MTTRPPATSARCRNDGTQSSRCARLCRAARWHCSSRLSSTGEAAPRGDLMRQPAGGEPQRNGAARRQQRHRTDRLGRARRRSGTSGPRVVRAPRGASASDHTFSHRSGAGGRLWCVASDRPRGGAAARGRRSASARARTRHSGPDGRVRAHGRERLRASLNRWRRRGSRRQAWCGSVKKRPTLASRGG